MGLVYLLWLLAGVGSLVGFIWLCGVAFRRHVGWGLAVFFLGPVAAIVFGVKHWKESKRPLLIYIGSCGVLTALFFVAFSAMGGFRAPDAAARAARGEPIGDEGSLQRAEGPLRSVSDSGVLSADEEAELRRAQAKYSDLQQRRASASDTRTIRPGSPSTAAEPPAARGGEANAPARRSSTSSRTSRENAFTTEDGVPVPPGYRRIAVGEADRYLGRAIRITNNDGNEQKGTLAGAHGDTLYVERHLSSGTVTFEMRASEVHSLLVAAR